MEQLHEPTETTTEPDHIPETPVAPTTKALLKQKKKRVYTEEQKKEMADRMRKVNQDRIENARATNAHMAELKTLKKEERKQRLANELAQLEKLKEKLAEPKEKTPKDKKPKEKKPKVVVYSSSSESDSSDTDADDVSIPDADVVYIKHNKKTQLVKPSRKAEKPRETTPPPTPPPPQPKPMAKFL